MLEKIGEILNFNKLIKRQCKANTNSKNLPFLRNIIINKRATLMPLLKK